VGRQGRRVGDRAVEVGLGHRDRALPLDVAVAREVELVLDEEVAADRDLDRRIADQEHVLGAEAHRAQPALLLRIVPEPDHASEALQVRRQLAVDPGPHREVRRREPLEASQPRQLVIAEPEEEPARELRQLVGALVVGLRHG
jgi:hypothetical protein